MLMSLAGQLLRAYLLLCVCAIIAYIPKSAKATTTGEDAKYSSICIILGLAPNQNVSGKSEKMK